MEKLRKQSVGLTLNDIEQ